MKNHKIVTALIVMTAILALMGFASMAYATVAPAKSIDGKAAIEAIDTGQIGIAPAGFATMTDKGAIETAQGLAGQMGKIEAQKTGGTETKAPMEIAAAEHVPKYMLNRTEGTVAETMKADIFVMKRIIAEGTVPRTLTGRFSGTAPIINSEMIVKIDMKKTGSVIFI